MKDVPMKIEYPKQSRRAEEQTYPDFTQIWQLKWALISLQEAHGAGSCCLNNQISVSGQGALLIFRAEPPALTSPGKQTMPIIGTGEGV